ncbi:glycoside hydrolase family 5 protein [Pedobacter changchengzhani]|uniref:Glycoside hydrolase family 5 protein n=1 Tax=Pedobacter changchengzhani TaxID=2529274 RepID=A0A4R5MNW1_9SPHI|nr:glycoside hydrolase family 5 protein [Pedobacter changchengzhani]TDG37286.1 glycoside hydrolase family 5 protein [Pedobacter changchengzhani]
MKKCIFRTVVIIATFLSTQFIANAQKLLPVTQHGKLSVEGGKIVDSSGSIVQLRGISLSWSIWGGRKYYNAKVVKWLKKDFDINVIRIAMAVEPDSGYLKDPVKQEELVTKVIDEAIKQGIYVLLDWHDHHADQHVSESKVFFKKMAKKYAGVPNMIYEIWNEPARVSWAVIKSYALEIIPEIRNSDPDALIIVGSSNWDQDVDITAKDPITGYSNIAYSFHFYASDPGHQEKLMAKADDAIAMGLPIFVTEWGVGEANGDGIFDTEKTDKWLNWLERNKLSWANWNLTDKKETTALLLPGAGINGSWPLKMLSKSGLYIRKQLRTLNK